MSSEARVAPRGRDLVLRYPSELPITRWREPILAALAEHRAIVVCGDTGSGKTTQLPKLCLEAGLGARGMIGHTQPRRIAARAVAARLAEETGATLGEEIGLKVRFTDRTARGTLVKVMTDGILLNEIREDRALQAYDALIIDEAHERSVNIDFILGYLRRIERRRPDLKLIITSATIDPERFSAHFGDAPILRVEGRSHPVEVRYRPPADAELPQAVVAAVGELRALDLRELGGGRHRDMLVFLPGERWIRDTAQSLARARVDDDFEILPLYARLSTARQDRIFHPGRKPRIVLATNVAETSLTVPRIRFVIDSGLARVSRYATRHRVQGLAVEPIARANAVQRGGRCGRLAPGVCVRLYSEKDYEARPEFTDPEILRTNLAGVLLRLEALRLGHIDDFPFLDAPPARAVNDARRLLHLLGAMDSDGRLTRAGKLMARLPLDPRLARLLVVAKETRALEEALVVAAALSVADPRDYPPEQLDAARRRHDELADARSDFLTYLALWRAYRAERARGNKALRAWCASRFLSLARLREWEDVHGQLVDLTRSLGWRAGARKRGAADYRAIHRAVLAAFVDYVGEHWEGRDYRGMQDARAALFPGTPVARKPPRWIVAAERVATERVYLRTVARINPRWVLQAAPHLVKREYRDPAWDRGRGRVLAREVLSVLGLTLSAEQLVDYGAVDPAEARQLFLRDALAADDLGANPPFLVHNRRVRAFLLDWEARLRSRSLYTGERGLTAFYRVRLPEDIHDRSALLEWCRHEENDLALRAAAVDLATREPGELPREPYPDFLELVGQRLALRYRYEPGAEADGVTLTVPGVLLHAIHPEWLEWLVPGMLPEKIVALLRALPKDVRRTLVPIPDTAAALVAELESHAGVQSLAAALREALARSEGVRLKPELLDAASLPAHLRMRIEVVDEKGKLLAAGRNLRALQDELAPRGRRRPAAAAPTQSRWTRTGLGQWDFPDLPDSVRVRQHGRALRLYPALIDRDGRVDLELLPPGPAALATHCAGVRRLVTKVLPQQTALIRQQTLDDRALVLSYHGIGSGEQLADDVLGASVEESFELAPPIRTRAAFERCIEEGRAAWVDVADRLRNLMREIVTRNRALRGALADGGRAIDERARSDMGAQLDALVFPCFLTATPAAWRAHLPRYLRGVEIRLQKVEQRHPKDLEFQERVHAAARRLDEWRQTLPPGWPWPEAMLRYRYMLEEFRVSLFAQQLGTAMAVSEKRLEETWRSAQEASKDSLNCVRPPTHPRTR